MLKKQKLQEKLNANNKEILLKEIPELRNEIERLNEELAMKEEELEKRMEDGVILKELFRKGIIDEDGNPLK